MAGAWDLIGKEAVEIALQGQTMGTDYTVKYIDRADGKITVPPEAVKQQVEARLQQVNAQMSTYMPDSDISRFNALPSGESMKLPQDFAEVLLAAADLFRATQGGLDVTLGGLVNIWGFGPPEIRHAPDDGQIAQALAQSGMDNLAILQNSDGISVCKRQDGLYLDLSSIAKGFGVDAVAHCLEAAGIADYLVEIGGELRACGKNLVGQAWRVAVEHPKQQAHPLIVGLDNCAVATSGNYRNCYTDESGRFRHHVIDGETGRPVRNDIASLSAIAPSSMYADGLATGLFALDSRRALALAEANGWAVFVIRQTEHGLEGLATEAFLKHVLP